MPFQVNIGASYARTSAGLMVLLDTKASPAACASSTYKLAARSAN